MDENKSWLDRNLNPLPAGIQPIFPCVIKKAKNAEIWDKNNRRYLDFGGGIAVMNVGHSHPKVLQAVKNQLELFQHTCFPVVPYSNYIQLAEEMNKLVPGEFPKKTFLVNTGIEAVENAIKCAKFHTKRPGIISFNGAFHGRTYLGMNLTGKIKPYKAGFGLSGGDVYHIPFPAKALNVELKDTLEAISVLFKSTVEPENIAAIIIEPVQGEGGFYQAPTELIIELRKICDKHGIVFIVDEVQTGFARTGKFMALEHYKYEKSIIPADILTFAKSMAAGFPLSGLTGRSEILDAVPPGGLGSTYGGNPVSVAAALAVIDIIKQENLLERSVWLGTKLLDSLRKLDSEMIAEVRGLGSMVAIEFQDSKQVKAADFTKGVQKAAFDRGLLLLTCGVNNNVVRCLYPLTIEENLFEEAIAIFEEAIKNPRL